MKVTKRDGKKVEFNKQKIQIAILKAFLDVDGEETQYAKDKAQEISNLIESMNKDLTIEEIQDIIVKKLMSSTRKDVATKYVEYRFLHKVARDEHKQFLDAIEEKLTASNVKNQNANVDEHSFGGRMGEMGSAVAKKYALDHIVSKMSRDNHMNNMIYIHDLDSYAIGSHNCLTIPFDKLLANGFNTRQADIRPANSVGTAFQLVAVLFQLQSLQQFGGVSASHLDWTMVPYIRKSFYKHYADALTFLAEDNPDGNGLNKMELPDEYSLNEYLKFIASMPSIEDDYFTKFKHFYKYALTMTERELRQAVEAMYHNLR